jgi:hypothetical protein
LASARFSNLQTDSFKSIFNMDYINTALFIDILLIGSIGASALGFCLRYHVRNNTFVRSHWHVLVQQSVLTLSYFAAGFCYAQGRRVPALCTAWIATLVLAYAIGDLSPTDKQ